MRTCEVSRRGGALGLGAEGQGQYVRRSRVGAGAGLGRVGALVAARGAGRGKI